MVTSRISLGKTGGLSLTSCSVISTCRRRINTTVSVKALPNSACYSWWGKKNKKKTRPSSWISDDEKAAEARESYHSVTLERLERESVKCCSIGCTLERSKSKDTELLFYSITIYLDLDHSLPFKAKQRNEWNYELKPDYFDICYTAYKLVCNTYIYLTCFGINANVKLLENRGKIQTAVTGLLLAKDHIRSYPCFL